MQLIIYQIKQAINNCDDDSFKTKLKIIEQLVLEYEDNNKYLHIEAMKQFQKDYLLLLKQGITLLEKDVNIAQYEVLKPLVNILKERFGDEE